LTYVLLGNKAAELNMLNLKVLLPEKIDDFRVDDFVDGFLSLHQLQVLPENALNDAVRNFVEKDERDAIKE
jgi:double-strand break repair protein MRE11